MLSKNKDLSDVLEKIKKLPSSPGVYFFLGAQRKILYIGKATSLKDRVRSYFSNDIKETRGPIIEEMLRRAKDIDYRKTDSVLEALILEAALIKKHQPPFNSKEKSDKSFNYIVITDEDFPRILIVRERDLLKHKTIKVPQCKHRGIAEELASLALPRHKRRGIKPIVAPWLGNEKALLSHFTRPTSLINLKSKILNLKSEFGPFPQSSTLKEALKIIRKIFPYRDEKCIPFTKQIKIPRYSAWSPRLSAPKPCFGRQIGLCPGICTGEISKEEYARTIRNITLLFEGKKQTLIRMLTKEMNASARMETFEKANEIKKQIFALKHIQDVSLIKPHNHLFFYSRELENKKKYKDTGMRIEGYDVAHMAGKHIVGAMVVVEGGEAQRSEYRKFNIKTVTKGNDVGALKEIIERRLLHHEWPFPKLMVVDGGAAQINAAKNIFQKYGIGIPIVGVVKDEFHRPKILLGDKKMISSREKEILLANSEAHRFAIEFHKKKRRIL